MRYTDEQIRDAQKRVSELMNSEPKGYSSPYKSMIDAALKRITDREPFRYDANADPLYARYKDMYDAAGKAAMKNAQAEAAANTGGFENSYGLTAGMAAYNDYLAKLSELAPELEERALKLYNAEGAELENELSAYTAADDAAYKQYQSEVDNYYKLLAVWAQIAAEAGTGTSSAGTGRKDKQSPDFEAIRDRLVYNYLNGGVFQGDVKKAEDYLNMAVKAGNITSAEAKKLKEQYLTGKQNVKKETAKTTKPAFSGGGGTAKQMRV